MLLIDTHCHLDAAEFSADRDQVLATARQHQLACIVMPAVARNTWGAVQRLAEQEPDCVYALGIHPMYIDQASDDDLEALASTVRAEIDSNSRLVAIGEIGLDYFVTQDNAARQQAFFKTQLALASAHDLPVIMHVRKSVDDILKHLRQSSVRRGIAHAFNGSLQQAYQFIELGFKLGFGGAMTYPRALHLRMLAQTLPLEAIVLETDAPDIPPEWVGRAGRNQPSELLKIAQELATLRHDSIEKIVEKTSQNACQALPKITQLCTPLQVLL